MDISIIILIAVVAVIALIIVVKAASRPKATTAEPHHEGNGLSDEMAAAVEDVAGEFLGVDAHPDLAAGAPDDLTVLKGLGPKAAAQLNSLGISRYAQIAALTEPQIAGIDARMGSFKGRIARDRWVEQARFLAAGDQAGFETAFGKLGG
jgi:predicted flap endonuclease-1-like 5' DNA nuclease